MINIRGNTLGWDKERFTNEIFLVLSERFMSDVRVIQLLQRKKDNATFNKTVKQKVSSNSDEFKKIVAEFIDLSEDGDRIYSSINSRNMDKSIREFKRRQLDADYQSTKDRNSFYFDMENRWISCLMSPASKVENYFLIDIDTKTIDMDVVDECIPEHIKLVLKYKTKNGIHLITEPFNPSYVGLVSELMKKTIITNIDIKKDAMMLLAY